MKKTFTIKSPEKMLDIAEKLRQPLSYFNGGALVVGLSGDLGAGKTTFVQEFAKALGVKNKITSPTFAIMKKYKIPVASGKQQAVEKKNFKNLIHIDAYRLKTGEDLRMLSWDEIIADPRNIILIEWPENVKEAMPKKYVKIWFEHRGEDSRKIKIQIPK